MDAYLSDVRKKRPEILKRALYIFTKGDNSDSPHVCFNGSIRRKRKKRDNSRTFICRFTINPSIRKGE